MQWTARECAVIWSSFGHYSVTLEGGEAVKLFWQNLLVLHYILSTIIVEVYWYVKDCWYFEDSKFLGLFQQVYFR